MHHSHTFLQRVYKRQDTWGLGVCKTHMNVCQDACEHNCLSALRLVWLLCADKLSSGLQRRVTVACQLVGSAPLLVLHDALEGVHEGDALAIMRAVHECARWVLNICLCIYEFML